MAGLGLFDCKCCGLVETTYYRRGEPCCNVCRNACKPGKPCTILETLDAGTLPLIELDENGDDKA